MTDQKAPKSEQTRTLILETALRLFQERGFDKTTMRVIAKEAGVSVGNAYYYFASKEHLVQGFYDRIGAAHQAAVRPILDNESDLQKRLAGVLTSWLDIAAPYHEFASQFFKNAADPESPLSPFSPESEPARKAAIDMHREVLAGAKTKVPEELADVLPELMWLSQMGLVLYWVFDRSPDSEKTHAARRARRAAHDAGHRPRPVPGAAAAGARGARTVRGLPAGHGPDRGLPQEARLRPVSGGDVLVRGSHGPRESWSAGDGRDGLRPSLPRAS